MLEGRKTNRGNLSGAELQLIFRAGLKEELLIAVRDLAAPRKFQEADSRFGEISIVAYTVTLQVRAVMNYVRREVIDIVAKGWSPTDRAVLKTILAVFVPPDDIKGIRIIAALQQVGAPVSENTIHEAGQPSSRHDRMAAARLAVSPSADAAPRRWIDVAVSRGRTKPDKHELARICGSSSLDRIHRLLDHLERSNLIGAREYLVIERSISVLGLMRLRCLKMRPCSRLPDFAAAIRFAPR